MALLAVDQRFIEDLQDIAFDLIEAEAADMSKNSPDERLAVRLRDHPIEEIALCRAEDAGRLEGGSRQHASGIVIAQAEHSQRDGLCDNHQKGVLEEQRVAFDLAAIDQLQELRPQLPFQCDGRIIFQLVPKRPKTVIGAPKRYGLLTKLKPHGDWIRDKRALERNGAVEPRQKTVRFVGIERRVLELYELIAAALEHHPLESVRRDADEALAFFALAVGEIVRHAPDHVVPFQIEVPLGFKNGAPNQGIESAPHFGNPELEIERTQLNTEFLDQELTKVRLHLIVARSRGEMM